MEKINLEDLYTILAPVAISKGQITYGQLSDRYYERTHELYEPHGTWDEPLGRLNKELDAIRWPPLSAVVVLKETREPGNGFWESSPNIPARPSDDMARITLYSQILRQVHSAPWPVTKPIAPPS